jgi:hypothetical protein
MDLLITTATSREEQDRWGAVAVLPMASLEQHGAFLRWSPTRSLPALSPSGSAPTTGAAAATGHTVVLA